MIFDNIATAILLAISAALAATAWRSWHYTPSRRILWLSLGFSLLAAKAALLATALFAVPDWQSWLTPLLGLDIAALAALYRAAL